MKKVQTMVNLNNGIAMNIGLKRQKGSRQGISSMEYAVLIVCLIIALLSMQTLLRRAISSKWKETADQFGSGRQYEPGVTVVTSTR